MIKITAFHTELPGPCLLILGAIHGNEICGPVAMNRIMAEIESGALQLKHGRAVFIPICKPRAYAQNVRFIERNLNRNLVPMAEPDCYEAVLGNLLCPYLEACDVLVDLHSTSGIGPSYVFIDPADADNMAFGAALGADWIVSNFAGAIAASGAKDDNPNWATGTTEYARSQGAMSLTLECGQHLDPHAPETAYRAIIRALVYLGMLEDAPIFQPSISRHVALEKCWFFTDAGTFTKAWTNLESVKAGALIAMRGNGEELRAPHDGIIVLPRPAPEPNSEWFYFGREIPV